MKQGQTTLHLNIRINGRARRVFFAVCLLLSWLGLPVRLNVAIAVPNAPETVISGTVFNDLNADGILSAGEQGIAGVLINAYDANNTLIASVQSQTSGAYQLSTSGAGPLRIELDIPQNMRYFKPSPSGLNLDNSTVRFVSSAVQNLNFGLYYPSSYCPAGTARLLTYAAESGLAVDNNHTGIYSIDPFFSPDVQTSFDENTGVSTFSPHTPPVAVAPIKNVGSVWGATFYAPKNLSLFSSVVHRHIGIGPLGYGGIYVVDSSKPFSDSVLGGTSLNGIATVSGGTIDLGSVNRVDGGAQLAPNAIPPSTALYHDPTSSSIDLDAFDKVGKVGFGGMRVSEDGTRIWLTNLNQRTLISVDARALATTLTGTVPASKIDQYPILGLPGIPTCTGGQFRPWAIKFDRGLGYLGGVCSGETSLSISDVTAYVLSFSPDNIGAGFSTALTLPMNYPREPVTSRFFQSPSTPPSIITGTWNAWVNTWTVESLTFNSSSEVGYPQPMLTDIEIADDGSMFVAFADRFSLQGGLEDFPAIAGGNGQVYSANSAGDVIKACAVGIGKFVPEGGAGCQITAGHDTGAAGQQFPGTSGHPSSFSSLPLVTTISADDGPSRAGEFYFEDSYVHIMRLVPGTYFVNIQHNENSTGGLALIPGTDKMLVASYDPVAVITTTADQQAKYAFTQGVRRISTSTGAADGGYVIVESNNGSPKPESAGKAAAIGDIEVICDTAPLEAGNRVWQDTNNNGIQDAGEPPIAGVVITLTSDTGSVVTTTTNISGQYVFTGLAPQTDYTLSLQINQTPLAGLVLAKANAGGDTSNSAFDDVRDSDATQTGKIAQIQFATLGVGSNNHGLDFGFASGASLGDFVWLDKNGNGVQDAGEPGVAGVKVTLHGPNGLVTSTVTTISGTYIFVGLTPGVPYFVTFTAPPNYGFTTPGQGTNIAKDSNANQSTGSSGTVILAPGEYNDTIDGGLVPAVNAVTLARFSARNLGNRTDLAWVTLNENNTLGFYVMRAPGRYSGTSFPLAAARVNADLIGGTGASGAAYHLIDTAAPASQLYSYWLVEVDADGRETTYGPATTAITSGAIFLPLVTQ